MVYSSRATTEWCHRGWLVSSLIVLVVFNNSHQVVGFQNELDDYIECGMSAGRSLGDTETRIYGGRYARPGEFPFHAGIFKNGELVCGGTIIDRYHILTAAHCVLNCTTSELTHPSSMLVTIGDSDIHTGDGEQYIEIKEIVANDLCGFNYDIAILTTRQPMLWRLTKNGFGSVNRICLPDADAKYQVDQSVTVSGWGFTNPYTRPSTLNTVDLKLISHAECKKAWHDIRGNQICASSSNGKDSCRGDSGGSLSMKRADGKSELVGIVSFGGGSDCAQEKYPGVYEKVSYHLDWIRKYSYFES